jgi:hypothetical protein
LTGKLTIPNSVTSIGYGAFAGCRKFTGALTIPNSVTSIRGNAFSGCSGFNGTLTIGNLVTSIGESAFYNCSGLTSIYVSAAIPPSLTDAFTGVPVTTVHIPCGSTSAYQGAAEWSRFTNYINRPFNLTVQSEDATKGTASITQANTCNNNNTAIITATPIALKYDFAQWSDGNTDNPRTLTLTQDTALTAQFASVRYDFSAVNEGQKIYYNITSSVAPLTVEVTYATASTYNDYSGAVVIPATVIYRGSTYSVTAIGEYAFRGSTGLTSVTIPNSVKTIGNSAFFQCSGLTEVTIPNSVTSIGYEAFSQCSGLTGILTIPNSVISIGNYAFYNCSELTSVTIPNSVISIGNYAFYDCIGLTGTLIIPNSVTSIGDAAFYGCSDLTSVIIPNSVKTIGMRAFYGCSDLTGTLTIPNSVTWMGEAAFRDCIGLTSVIIGNSVETIGNYAFRNCRNLKTVYFKAITPPVSDYSTFYDVPTNIPVHVPCGRTSAYQNAIEWSLFTNYIDDLPLFNLTVQSEDATKGTASVTESNTCDDNTAIITATPIALKYDFAQWSDGNTDNPRTVTVPKDTILTAQFMPVRYDFAAKNDDGKKIYYNITSAVEPLTVEVTYATESTYNDYSGAVVIPATVIHLGVTYAVTAIGNSAFRSSTGLTSVTIPNSVTSIGNSAFESCRILTSVTIGNAVKTIGNEAFRDCISLTGTLTIPNSVTSMGNSAFYNCKKLDSVTIGNSVKTIGGWAFYYCSELDSVTIGNSVETIGEAAFAECSGLASVTIGNSVKTIGISAFYNCKKLDSVTIYAVTPPSVGTGAFTGVPVATPVHIPCGSTPAYQGTAGWSSFANINGTLPIYRNENAVICQNELPYTWRDTTFQAGSISGEYVLEISGSCDSIVTLNLTVLPEVSTTFTDTICFGATYTANGFNASTTGVHTQDLQAVNGCDSTVTLNLTVLPEVSTTFTDTICFGTAYTANGFENKDTTGVYTLPLTNVNGCDSIVTLNLTVLPEVPLTTFTDTICFGETYTANGFTESVTGVYTQDLQAVNGCDSTVTLTLTVLPEVSTTFTDTICFGETYTANGFNASTTGVYTQDLQAVNGCDSTVTLNLTVLPEVPTTIINATICFGETYTANGFTENATGTYTQPLKAVNGCDSTVTLNLTVLPEVPPTIINATICHGTAYTENGFNENATGVYTQPLKAVNGCDSIVTLNLTVLPEVPTTIINATICFGETYTENGFNASTTGVHTQDLQAVNGCDSIVTLNLTVLPEVSTTFTDTICFGTAYTANGFTESVTGVYTQDLQAVNGCDSIVKLHLTVLPEVPITTFTDTICFGELYAANGFDADTTGVYSRTVPNVDSCDSIVELHLTVLPEVPVTIINATICHGKTYTENGFNASTTGVHTLPLKDVNGCDSIVTLNLTVLPEVPTTIINATICHGATYTENGFNASITGVHTQDLQAVNGCDSIVTLHLTVLPEVPPTIINATICHGETYSANGFNEKDSTDVYTRTFENVNGCDSIVTLHLTVNPLPEVPVYEDIVHGGDYDLPVVENGVWTNEAGEVVTVASASGTYTLTITDPETGCENSTTLTVGITTGINNISAENHFVISPNPARDFVNISGVSGDANVEITDLSGRTVGAWHAVSLQTGEISINVSHLAKGVYLIKVNNAIGKFVKN